MGGLVISNPIASLPKPTQKMKLIIWLMLWPLFNYDERTLLVIKISSNLTVVTIFKFFLLLVVQKNVSLFLKLLLLAVK